MGGLVFRNESLILLGRTVWNLSVLITQANFNKNETSGAVKMSSADGIICSWIF